MGFCYGASIFNQISEEAIQAVAGPEFSEFQRVVKAVATSIGLDEESVLEEVAQDVFDYENTETDRVGESDVSSIVDAYNQLCTQFEQRTGLTLYLTYVGEGLRGSDVVEQLLWHVGNMYCKSPAALAFEEKYGPASKVWFITGS